MDIVNVSREIMFLTDTIQRKVQEKMSGIPFTTIFNIQETKNSDCHSFLSRREAKGRLLIMGEC